MLEITHHLLYFLLFLKKKNTLNEVKFLLILFVCVQLFLAPWTVWGHQASLPVEFSK